MQAYRRNAFTLVELIVVVTILAILGSIGFVSYSSYLSGVRDANRISSLQSISDGLQLFSTRGALPSPDSSIDIISGGEVIGVQGDAGTTVLEIIDYSKAGLDPADDIPFTYYLSANKRFHQLMAFLEESSNLQSYNLLFSQANAVSDLSNRYPTFYGKKLGILTDPTTLIPAQDAGVDIDISTTTDQYTIHLGSNQSITGDNTQLVQFTSLPNRGGRGYSIDDSGRLIYVNLELGVSRSGLVGEYHLDGNFNDSSGLGNHGTSIGGGSYVNAQIGQGIEVEANQNPFIPVTSSPGLDIATNQYTLSSWFRIDAIQGQLFQNQVFAGGGYFIQLDGGAGDIFTRHCGPGTCATHRYPFSPAFTPGQYYHLVVTFDETTMKAYMDGKLISELSGVTDMAASGRTSMGFAGYQFVGEIDQVRIYDRALNNNEVQLLFEE